jgi:aspartyl-tRNA(Asn)/glutamyl-tRNA(Gln) amidotransferase subunit A
MASSLDQVGTITKTVADAKILLSAIAGYDPNDAQSNQKADQKDRENPDTFVDKKRKIALPTQFLGEGLDPKIRTVFLALIDKLRAAGHQVDEIDMPILAYSVPIYYILMPAEVSTNLARFDGIRFGYQDDTMKYDDLQAYYDHVRSTAFGPEVQRRILLGTYVLSSAHYEGFYLKATQARQKLIQDMDKTFADYDLIVSPTSPEVAWKIGAKGDDPLKMYLADLYTIPANLAGIPAISLPMGMVEDH